MSNKQEDKTKSCMDEYDPNSLSVEQASNQIDNLITPLSEYESSPIENMLDRIIATDIQSPSDVPNYTNSAMDGYAIEYSQLHTTENSTFEIATTILAGDTRSITLEKGQCARIMTGAKLPSGTDTVIMQEQIQRLDSQITISHPVSMGQNVRHIGEDISHDDIILNRGHRISSADIGLLASIGVARSSIFRKVKVAYFSTGNELVSVGKPLKPGQLYDSNRYTLHSMLSRFGADITDLGVVADTEKAVEDALQKAAECADVVITTGGVSVGEADFVKTCLDKIGHINFWKIAMKPGRPLAFGEINSKIFFGLPGNPVSTMVTFMQFVLPALRKLSGNSHSETVTLTAISEDALSKRKGRRDYQRGVLSMDENGKMLVRTTGMQGSHILRSMSLANCFVILSEECETVEAGSMVQVQPFSAFW